MKITIRNTMRNIPGYRHMPETYEFEGNLVKPPKWVNFDAVALTTGDPKFPVRLIDKNDIISIDDEEVELAIKPSSTVKVYEVAGSKGNSYTVTIDGDSKSCSCPAFSFRRHCKHIASVIQNAS